MLNFFSFPSAWKPSDFATGICFMCVKDSADRGIRQVNKQGVNEMPLMAHSWKVVVNSTELLAKRYLAFSRRSTFAR